MNRDRIVAFRELKNIPTDDCDCKYNTGGQDRRVVAIQKEQLNNNHVHFTDGSRSITTKCI
jgi:hypothetical protein